ncbi:MAG TPA: diguanylate cyclase [Patescibacteria group bacterium]|nr:diguanylate cyclase [Patescibacteria group bacterium]
MSELEKDAEVRRLETANRQLAAELENALADAERLRREVISARHRAVEAHIDPLTRLPMRAVFEEKLAEEVAKCNSTGKCLAVVMVDLGELKKANDWYGHIDGGDRLLERLAKILKNAVRRSDVVTRWGGDEFALILVGADEDVVRVVLHRITGHVQSAEVRLGVRQQSARVQLKAAIGVAYGCGSDVTIDIVKQADQAMIAAKEHRKYNDLRVSRIVVRAIDQST